MSVELRNDAQMNHDGRIDLRRMRIIDVEFEREVACVEGARRHRTGQRIALHQQIAHAHVATLLRQHGTQLKTR